MKATIFSSLFLLLAVNSPAQVTYGLKGGLNLAKIHVSLTVPGFGSASNSSDNRTSFHAGFFLRAPLSSTFSIQPELVYSGQGGASSGGELNADYINVPVMILYHASPKVYLQAGPQLGFLISAKSGGVSVADEMNTVDFGLGFGIGAQLSEEFSLSFRYNLGLTNITKVDTSGAPAGTSLTTTNEVMQFTLGYRISNL